MNAAMTWEQMLAAVEALGGYPSLRMRKPGDWYVEQRGVEVKQGSVLASLYGNGATPEAAVRDHWRQLTTLNPGEVIVLSAYGANRRHVRWNGFMWAEIPRVESSCDPQPHRHALGGAQ